MIPLTIKIINASNHPLPEYASVHAAGMDLKANLSATVKLQPMQRSLIPTGLFIELPPGHEAQIRPRSGLALKHGITVLNSPGTIDADYRGEIQVLLINLSDQVFEVKDGERIAQMVIAKHEQVDWYVVSELAPSGRGAGGFGSTGR